jgi:hypothetical protein
MLLHSITYFLFLHPAVLCFAMKLCFTLDFPVIIDLQFMLHLSSA